MPERLVEITIPQHETETLLEIVRGLTDRPVFAWPMDDNMALCRVTLDVAHVESLIDPLQSRFADFESFRILILAVEANLPREKPPESQSVEEQQNNDRKKRPDRVSRDELYDDLAPAARPTRVFFVLTILSTLVAAIGVTRDSPAIVIGAMVIAPLLGPNMVLALATTIGDRELAIRSLGANVAGVLVAGLVTVAISPLLDVSLESVELAGRTEIGLTDLILALAAGAAGALAFTSGVATSLIGVMVAVALLPPLVVGCLLLANGDVMHASQALLLLATNIICVNLAAVAVFAIQGVLPRRWWEKEQSKRTVIRVIIFWLIMLAIVAGMILLSRQVLPAD